MTTNAPPCRVERKVVVVAVRARKEMPKTALVWALTHIVRPGDNVKLLVVVPDSSSSKKVWDFSRLSGECTHRRSLLGTRLEQADDVSELCSQMLVELHTIYDPLQVMINVKVVSGSNCGVTSEIKSSQPNWVILDKHLKQEKKSCMAELDCNLVVMKKSKPKVLRLNLTGPSQAESDPAFSWPIDVEASSGKLESEIELLKGPSVTPASSPEPEFSLNGTDIGTSSISSSDPGASPFTLSGSVRNQKEEFESNTEKSRKVYDFESEFEVVQLIPSSRKLSFSSCPDDTFDSSSEQAELHSDDIEKPADVVASTCKGFIENLRKLDLESDTGTSTCAADVNLRKSVREAIFLSKSAPGPPPLCSLCRHKSPAFGNPPKWFSYTELEIATDGFSGENFLAEGGFGSVHRGVLSDGQVVAVKQHKMASSQGDLEFCSEVEVLSCAQHRNVVTLIGFCIEDGRRLLVYEYICNGSLDARLFGLGREALEWSARQKIAVGAARGLRYLHEECRVGCIVHRDMRPNNILITHDFEPLVGDFGLARWQPHGDLGVETRIIGTFGYLAPEYVLSGQITEKADVYSFGVVLLELVTGRKAVDIKRPKGQQCLTEWARPLLEKQAFHELVDPRLGNQYSEKELHTMLQCSSCCIRRDPIPRPRMSQVLRMLEGYVVLESAIQKV